MENRVKNILFRCMKSSETDPVALFNTIARENFIRMHGPEHHILDGACILTAFKNAGGDIDLAEGLAWVAQQGMKMPGAACGHWGVCGSASSIGAALSFLDGTGPLSTDGSWGRHMRFTSAAIARMGEVNGPRCCKRDAYISFEAAIDYINENYPVKLPKSNISCSFYPNNVQCIGQRCPYRR